MPLNSVHAFTLAMSVLFVIQLYRCVHKYQKFETINNRHVLESDSAEFPYVTINPVPGYKRLKSQSFFELEASVDDYCVAADGSNGTVDYKTCLEDNMHRPDEIVSAVFFNQEFLPMEEVLQPSPPLLIPLGRVFTFRLNREFQGEGQRFQFKLRNRSNSTVQMSLVVTFHFKDTFFPYVYLDAKNFDNRADQKFIPSTHNHGVISLLLYRRHRISTPENPCVDDPDYSVLRCTEEYIADTLGCSSPWTNSETHLPPCSTKSEFDLLVRIQARLFQMGTSDFLRLTGCHIPCVQNETEIVEFTELRYPYFTDGDNSVVLIVVSTSVIEIRESLIYDVNSLVGEIGGSLGLFLGMSMVTLYKELVVFARSVLPGMRKKKGKGEEESKD